MVHGDHITLGQLLKVAGIIGTGGEAKFYLSETVVIVNGEPEQRRAAPQIAPPATGFKRPMRSPSASSPPQE